ncbi:MAG: site-specific integrase [Bacteroidales bacterium]|nr:site-specific integrase [Bacteroidales bacterium]
MARITPRYSKITGKLMSYCITVSKGRDYKGNEITVSKTIEVEPSWSERKARREAEAAAALFEEEVKKGQVPDSDITFKDYAEYVIRLKEARGLKATTVSRYRSLTGRIYPEIGHIKLKDLTPRHLNDLYTKLKTEKNQKYAPRAIPRKPLLDRLKTMTCKSLSELSGISIRASYDIAKGRETTVKSAEAVAAALNMDVKKCFAFTESDICLSDKTILEHHRLISMILRQALREDIVYRNVAAQATPPSVKKKEVNYFDMDQMNVIRTVLKEAPVKWRCLVEIFIVTGARRGETLGLKWDDVDLENKQLTIHENLLYIPERGIYLDTPKTETSNRKISLPDGAVATLKEYRDWQEEEKQRLGEFYQDQNFVFSQDTGSPMHPDSINTWMTRWMDERCGFHINPHAFRHSMASMLYFSGVDPVTISKRLGHANVSTTANIYAHLMDKSDQESADVINRLIYSGDQDKDKKSEKPTED